MGWTHSQETMVCLVMLFSFGHVSKPDRIWNHRQLKKKASETLETIKNKLNTNRPLY